jgi:predicted nucleotidyltransferase
LTIWLSAFRSFACVMALRGLEVFGSVARREARPGSDVDLLVTFGRGVRPGHDFFAMQDELEQILGWPRGSPDPPVC